MQDGDEGVALESCEFWTAFCEAQVEPAVLRPFLGRLVPVLLKNMVYDEYDEEVQDAEAAEDADHAGDTDQEIKPFISRYVAMGCVMCVRALCECVLCVCDSHYKGLLANQPQGVDP